MEQTFSTQQDVFSYIRTQEAAFKLPVTISEGYEWSMAKHIKLSTLYPLSQFETGNNDSKPFKQIIQPILNMQYRAEGFDVKDILLYVNDRKENYKSFLLKKYHEKYLRENDLDTIIDDSVESYVDMGGTLLKCVQGRLPEVVPWLRIAFCDQTDILSGPICEKHSYSPDQLKEMEKAGWGDEENGATMTIDELITLGGSFKIQDATGKITDTPGQYIEVYELHGTLPDWWLNREGFQGEEEKFTRQLQIVSFYKNKQGDKEYVRLFSGREEDQVYEFEKRVKKVWGRALGVGGAEELFEAQVWANYSTIRLKEMLDAASKVILQTADKTLAKRNNVRNIENLQILTHDEGKPLTQVDTQPRSAQLFENAVAEWETNARQIAAANEAIMGEQPTSGTPFKLQELITAESHSFHEYKKGKLAKFWEGIYRRHIIPMLVKEMDKGQEFLSTLDLDEMEEVAKKLAVNEANRQLKEKILRGELVTEQERQELKEKIKQDFMGRGNRKFIKALKNELQGASVDIEINVAGKQKYLSQVTDKLVNVLRFMLSTYNPQTQSFAVFDDPRMAKTFENIIEYSGLSPMDFYAQKPEPKPQMIMPQGQMPQNNVPLPAGQPSNLTQNIQ